METRKLSGLLNIDKPADMTSRAAVNHVVRQVRRTKVGHAGTLDPLATGVLIICVGPATRLIPHVQQMRKVYRAEFLLGRRSDTDDVTGEIIEVPQPPAVSRDDLESVLSRFVGKIEQVPPKFSAVHVNGQRAYKLARRGEDITLAAKTVEVHRIDLLDFEYPRLQLEIACGSGTYIRSIGRDVGDALGCGAVMSTLVRTRIGPFHVEDSAPLNDLNRDNLADHLHSAAMAVSHLPRHVAAEEDLQALRHGRMIRTSLTMPWHDQQMIAILTSEGELACLARYRQSDQTLAPKQVLLR